MTRQSQIDFHGTTILGIRHNGQVAVAGDGQVTLGTTIMKGGARKVRRIYNDQVICGFAGATGDAFTLFDRLEAKVQEYHGNLLRAAVELSKDWRTDKYLRHLEALLVAANSENMLVLSGNGDVIEPDDAIAGIGSGGAYAVAAARALKAHSQLDATAIAHEAMLIASGICIYTNQSILIETL